jgi:hypothetical protein
VEGSGGQRVKRADSRPLRCDVFLELLVREKRLPRANSAQSRDAYWGYNLETREDGKQNQWLAAKLRAIYSTPTNAQISQTLDEEAYRYPEVGNAWPHCAPGSKAVECPMACWASGKRLDSSLSTKKSLPWRQRGENFRRCSPHQLISVSQVRYPDPTRSQ